MTWIRQCVAAEQYRFTRHAWQMMRQRHITRSDVTQALLGGDVIETTTDDRDFTCWLVLGQRFNGDDVHVACKGVGIMLQVNTVYFPDEEFWQADAKTRR